MTYYRFGHDLRDIIEKYFEIEYGVRMVLMNVIDFHSIFRKRIEIQSGKKILPAIGSYYGGIVCKQARYVEEFNAIIKGDSNLFILCLEINPDYDELKLEEGLVVKRFVKLINSSHCLVLIINMEAKV